MKNEIWKKINESNSIVILTHENPDGDAIGSMVAFFRILNNYNKNVMMVAKNISNKFNYLSDVLECVTDLKESIDLAIILDCATKERVYDGDNLLDRCKYKIVIDHHDANTRYGDINYIEGDTSSCTQLLYYLFKDWDILMDREVLLALMTGLLTDTNGFRNSNVDSNSFLMAKEIIDYGIDVYELQRNVLSKITIPQYRLMKVALDRLEFFMEGKIAFSYITREDMDSFGASLGDHEGLVEIGRNIDGVEVSIFMREDEDGCYRISLRSNSYINVLEIAKKFNGNGHKMAAGVKFLNSFKETKDLIINETISKFY